MNKNWTMSYQFGTFYIPIYYPSKSSPPPLNARKLKKWFPHNNMMHALEFIGKELHVTSMSLAMYGMCA